LHGEGSRQNSQQEQQGRSKNWLHRGRLAQCARPREKPVDWYTKAEGFAKIESW
jgi:hypothetical protein